MKKTKTYVEIVVGSKVETKYLDSKDYRIGEHEPWREHYKKLRDEAK